MTKFAGFIMTYERAEIIPQTIAKIFEQSLPPSKLLVVDNSESNRTLDVVSKLNDTRVQYYRVGYNAGPAGAAAIGLKLLSSEGFDWIYWCDDDDPPTEVNAFRDLIQQAGLFPDAGALGSIGGVLNRVTGRTRNLTNRELGAWREVDFVPGNKNFIIRGDVARKGILPSSELFFGFEELDYCLKIKRGGFRIYVDGKKWLDSRVRSGNVSSTYRWRGAAPNQPGIRQYYSVRNILFVMWKNHFYLAVIYLVSKAIVKAIASFRKGFKSGKKFSRLYLTGLFHFAIGRKGRYNVTLK